MAKTGIRRDSKHRVLRRGESIRWDGKYQFKYHVNGKAHFVYSWRLEPTDKLPAGKKPCLSLRELEKQIGYDLDSQMHPEGRSMTVEELVERYLSTRIGVKPNTKANYNFVKNIMKKEDFYYKKIGDVKTSDKQFASHYDDIKTDIDNTIVEIVDKVKKCNPLILLQNAKIINMLIHGQTFKKKQAGDYAGKCACKHHQ